MPGSEMLFVEKTRIRGAAVGTSSSTGAVASAVISRLLLRCSGPMRARGRPPGGVQLELAGAGRRAGAERRPAALAGVVLLAAAEEDAVVALAFEHAEK